MECPCRSYWVYSATVKPCVHRFATQISRELDRVVDRNVRFADLVANGLNSGRRVLGMRTGMTCMTMQDLQQQTELEVIVPREKYS